jgi:predicted enzyme related to lactoylglutathione lyase
MSTEHGHFHWNELMTTHRDAAKDFYSETLGWTYESFPMADGGDYAVCMMDGQPVAGMVEVTDEDRIAGLPDCWFPYISVDDIDVRLERKPFQPPKTAHRKAHRTRQAVTPSAGMPAIRRSARRILREPATGRARAPRAAGRGKLPLVHGLFK